MEKEIKKYIASVEVTSVNGYQTFSCYAYSKEEAFDKFKNGEMEFEDEELEVTNSRGFDYESIEEVK